VTKLENIITPVLDNDSNDNVKQVVSNCRKKMTRVVQIKKSETAIHITTSVNKINRFRQKTENVNSCTKTMEIKSNKSNLVVKEATAKMS
jgi:hypothetical protein